MTTTRTAKRATVTFRPHGAVAHVPAGATILDAATDAGVQVEAPCGGQGRCGRCKVRAEGSVTQCPHPHLSPAEADAGFVLACQTLIDGDVAVTVPAPRERREQPRGHAIAQPEALPLTCDWRQDPAVRTFEVDIEPPSLLDNTNDFDRLRRALAQQHGIKEVRAELPILRRLGHDLRAASWKVNVTLEMRDWVYGTYLPPRLIRVYPSAFGQRSMGWP